MKVTAILCNHAEAQNGLLYASGAGINRANIPPGLPGPWVVSLGIGILVAVPWTQTNQQHTLEVDLLDADGHPVEVPTGPDTTQPFKAGLAFNVGRPPELQTGEEQSVALAVNVPALPLGQLGEYRFTVRIDGSPEAELHYRLVTQTVLTMGSGPTALPRFGG